MTDQIRPRKAQQRSIDSLNRIIQVAARLFIENGYRGTSVNDIIAEAESNKTFFYRKFPGGKQDVARGIMENTLTMDGLTEQPLKLQEFIDIGMILAYRIAHEDALLAALKLSFEHGSAEEYGTPWEDWVTFNTGQITEAQQRGEVRPHVDAAVQARQIPGTWSGMVLTAIVLDGGLHDVEKHVARCYMNLVAALAVPEVVPDLDFSADRGERLYTEYLKAQEPQVTAASE